MKQSASSYEKAAHETLRSAYEICERRIAAAVAAERERCAALVDEMARVVAMTPNGGLASNEYGYIAAKIRARAGELRKQKGSRNDE